MSIPANRLLLVGFMGAVLWSCQTSAPTEPNTRDRLDVVASFSLAKTDPWKFPDSGSWKPQSPTSEPVDFSIDSSGNNRVYTVNPKLSKALGSDTLQLTLWSKGLKLGELFYVAGQTSTRQLNLLAHPTKKYDSALNLVADLFAQTNYPVTTAGMEMMVAHRFLNGELPAIPVELSRSNVLDFALIEASASGKPLAKLSASWNLGISEDSARTRILVLIADGRISTKDSSALFPPAPLRTKTSISVVGTVQVGGDPASIRGAFEWNDSLGLVAFRYVVLKGTDTVKNLLVAGLPSPSTSDREAKLDGSATVAALSSAAVGEYLLVVLLQDGSGNLVRSSVTFQVVAPDQAGPQIRWIAPGRDTTVENSTSMIALRVQVQDPSGVDSVHIAGQKVSDLGGGTYLGLVELLPTGTASAIHVRAWDKLRNSSDSAIEVTRKSPTVVRPLRLSLVEPSARRGIRLEASVDSIKIRWAAFSDLGLSDTSIRIGGVRALRENDSTWSRTVYVPGSGSEIAFPVVLVDAGGRLGSDTIWLSRTKFVPRPALRAAFDSTKGDPALRNGVHVTRADSANLSWIVEGECSDCSARIDGIAVNLSGGTFASKRAIPLGTSGHVATLVFEGQIVSKDSIAVHRYPRLVLERISPASDTVDNQTTAQEVTWKASGAASVKIDGVVKSLAANGQYSIRLENLKPGKNTTRLVAQDSLGNIDSSVVNLFKVPRVDLSVVPDKTGDQWDSASCTITSLTAGASLLWSTDSAKWMPVPTDGRVWIRRTGRIYARGTMSQFLTANVASPSLTIKHTNTAPTYKRLVPDTIKVLEDSKPFRVVWAGSISMGAAGDSMQVGRFAISSIGTGSNLFASGPSLDSTTGIMTFSVLPNATGNSKFRIVLRDDGGVGNWGSDSSKVDSFVVVVQPVNDAPQLDSFPSVNVKISGVLDKLSGPSGNGTETGQTVTFNFSPMNDQARNCFVQAPNIVMDLGLFRMLHFITNPRCSGGSALFRMTIKDNGGTANGGVDTAATILNINLVDTIQDAAGNAYHYRMMGSNYWLLENIGSTCKTCKPAGTSFYEGDARTACPKGWRLPTPAEWRSLVTEAAKGGTDADASKHLRSTSGWRGTTSSFVDYEYNGDNSTGFNIVPDYWVDMRYGGQSIGHFWTSSADEPMVQFDESFTIGILNAGVAGSLDDAMVRCVQ